MSRLFRLVGDKPSFASLSFYLLVDERIIKSIPKVLVPASILNGFSKQRYNHVHRMIKHKCSISKNGEWSISKLV